MAQIDNLISRVQKKYPRTDNKLDELVSYLERNPDDIPEWLNFNEFSRRYSETVEKRNLIKWTKEIKKYTPSGVKYAYRGVSQFTGSNDLQLGHFVTAHWHIGHEKTRYGRINIRSIHRTGRNLIREYLEYNNIIQNGHER